MQTISALPLNACICFANMNGSKQFLSLLLLCSSPGCVAGTWTWVTVPRPRRRRRSSSGSGKGWRCCRLPSPTARAARGAAAGAGAAAWPAGRLSSSGTCVWLQPAPCSWLRSFPWCCCPRCCCSTPVSSATQEWVTAPMCTNPLTHVSLCLSSGRVVKAGSWFVDALWASILSLSSWMWLNHVEAAK